jgi:hypothetical protein
VSLLDRVRAYLATREAREILTAHKLAVPPPAQVTDLTGATHRPLVLTPEFRKAMAHRVALAAPTGPADFLDVERLGRISGLPADVLITLEALAQMADRGNRIAAQILIDERRRLGIDADVVSYRRENR